MKDNFMEQEIKKSVKSLFGIRERTVHPAIAILVAIVIAGVISLVNLFLFIRSDMYEKVLLIQNPEQILVNDETIDISSPLSSDELKIISSDIDNLFESLKDDKDYPSEDISEASLGF